MSTSVVNRSVAEIVSTMEELEILSQKEKLSSQEQRRNSWLLAKLASLRAGVSPSELRNFETDQLRRKAGLERLPERNATWLPEEIDQEWRSFARGAEVRGTCVPSDLEVRANLAGQQSITYTQQVAGGTFVPEGFYPRALESMKQYDQIFEDWACTPYETETGNSSPIPAWDDVTNQSVQIAEGTQSAEVDIANFGSQVLNAYTFRSKLVAVSNELIQDSAFPIGAILERIFAKRHARGVGNALVRGTGVNAPTGLLTAALSAGAPIVIASGSSSNDGSANTGSNSIGTNDLWSMVKNLNPIYRPGAVWAMTSNTLIAISELLDKMGRPLVSLVHGHTGDDPRPCLLGHYVAVCPSVPEIGAASSSVVLYNPAFFIQRRVPSSMYVQRFVENINLVQSDLTGFQSFYRCDSNLVAPNSGFVPAVVLQQHS